MGVSLEFEDDCEIYLLYPVLAVLRNAIPPLCSWYSPVTHHEQWEH